MPLIRVCQDVFRKLCSEINKQPVLSVPAENAAVVWTRPGRAFTIQCRHPELGQDSLTLKRGIDRSDVLFMNSESKTIKTGFKDRLEINGAFPNTDILIKNLTSDDIGPYWCCYTKINKELNEIQETEGTGSVLLVVSGKPKSSVP